MDLNAVKKSISARVKQQNLASQQAKGLELAMVRAAEGEVTGSKQAFEKTFVFSRPRVRGEIIWGKGYDLQGTAILGSDGSHDVDYSDGTNVVAMRGGGKAVTDYPKRGIVSRKRSSQLKYTAYRFGDSQFLFGAPVSELLKGGNLVKTSLDEYVFRVAAPVGSRWDGLPVTIAVSRRFWRPTSLELRTLAGQIMFQQKALSWKQYSDGIWFPQKIVAIAFSKSGKPASQEELDLVAASWNSTADLSQLDPKLVVPKGTTLDDYRFSPERREVRYHVREQLPPDATVLRLVEAKEKTDAQGKLREKMTATRDYVLPIGALIFVFGIFWFRRNRQTVK